MQQCLELDAMARPRSRGSAVSKNERPIGEISVEVNAGRTCRAGQRTGFRLAFEYYSKHQAGESGMLPSWAWHHGGVMRIL